MIASTRLTQRRIEREEVDRYLTGVAQVRAGTTDPVRVAAGR